MNQINTRPVFSRLIICLSVLCYVHTSFATEKESVLFEGKWKIKDDMPEYIFKVIGTSHPVENLGGLMKCETEIIEIQQSNSRKNIMKLKTQQNDGQYSGISLDNEDLNFDGYRDLRLPANV